MQDSSKLHVIEPKGVHTNTAILLHGRGSSGEDFANELFEEQGSDGLSLRDALPVWRWIFPSAPVRKSTRFDEELQEWFDVWSLDSPELKPELQQVGLDEATTTLVELVQQESQRIPSHRIVLGGISQGCATSLHALLSGQLPELGGFVGLSGWGAPLSDWSRAQSLKLPIFLGHAEDDNVVEVRHTQKLYQCLKEANVELKIYDHGGHWITEPEEVDDIVAFLRKVDTS